MSELENPTEQNLKEETASQLSPDQLSDILLVLNKEKMRIEAVKGIGKNGELETVPADEKNQNQFMRVDKHGDFFSNFFSNFFSQIKNPTNFSFFKVPAKSAIKTADELQKSIDAPSDGTNKILSKYEVTAEKQHKDKSQNQNNMEKPEATQQTNLPGTNHNAPETNENRYKVEEIDWNTMSKLGLHQEKLEKMNVLDDLLKGFKTDKLIPVSLNLGTVITRMDARLSLQKNPEGEVTVAIHGIRKKPNLDFKFFGHEFSKEDKQNLLSTGNMGRVVELENLKNVGEKIPSIISIDKLTNEIVALRTDRIKIPDVLKGVVLNADQKQTLMDGKPLYLEGMTSNKGEPFDGRVQFNAEKRYVEFLFNNTITNKLQPNQVQEVPKVFRDKELTDKQYEDLKAGKSVKIEGLIDKKGKGYQGYITLDKETQDTKFTFENPNELKAKAQPAEENKTQVAVNSEGKTNESTKGIKEPLKSGQSEPDNQKQKETQQVENKRPLRSKGPKV
ncbi:DUF3945 domain-containing protein [Pedobacter sp. ISL-68]|uniref:DUF3945 domain-containing protein n=1 Tax=unclassified Pedobacter TaxID=2628915 RepID=UPI001BE94B50|nr:MULTISPECIES: DUF3945 domain-containing protein [unclassified Pedobacter]MBT2559793.1 DUF3945 domain-containing protein [Pedobacter sp. ISL-64]MBT2592098.1 DUF3945 domain-containing protein [Pedobacter sp. ISL-68]